MPANRSAVRKIAVVGMLSAIGAILMFVEFPVAFLMPPFIKLDFSELPALIASFALGPFYGAAVCLIKNLLHLFATTSGGVGELSNFLLGVCFVVPAGLIYKHNKNRLSALFGAIAGAVIMGVVSIFTNYYIVYPIYTAFMPMDAIIGAYKLINPSVNTLWDALIWFNLPFTVGKCMCSVIITFLIYKPLSYILKGTAKKEA